MNLLAIETATTVCSVALWLNGSVAVELTLNRPRAHAENLVPLLADALRYGGLRASDVNVVAVSSGPGSYTGLRIGASTAKGFAAAGDAVLVEVPSLEAIAYGSRGILSEGDVIVAAFDARRDEVFAGAFQVKSSSSSENRDFTALRPASAVRTDEAAEWLGDVEGRVVLVGDGGEKLHAALSSAGIAADRQPDSESSPRAATVAVLGARRFADGKTVDLARFEPHYLKEFVAKKPSITAFEKLPF